MLLNQSGELRLTAQEQQELLALAERIIDSGALGKSKVYCRILRYLVNCAIEGSSPKETSIAIDVLERDTDFDISRDSIVRVHMYQLRNKLKKYFTEYGAEEQFHLSIPKGQYGIAVEAGPGMDIGDLFAEPVVAEPLSSSHIPILPAGKPRPAIATLLALALLVLLSVTLNLYLLLGPARPPEPVAEPAPVDPFTRFGFWANMFDNDLPILILVGDYYIFGERDTSGEVSRMVRDFEINSRADFSQRTDESPAFATHYVNLNLSYVPTGVAVALAELLPFLYSHTDDVQIKVISELDTTDLVSNHIIYLGLFSGLAQLHDLMFAASGLYIGATYDELHALENGAYYLSSYNTTDAGGGFRDYGILSAFTAPRGNQFIMLTGMRDAGLLNTVEQAINLDNLAALQESLQMTPDTLSAFEALYEVAGLQNTKFTTQLIHAQSLDSAIIWEARLVHRHPKR